jgi:hypothetical protein
MTTTKSDIIISGIVGDNAQTSTRYFVYSYPLCFQQPINVTCLNDVEVPSCDQNEVSKLNTTYQRIDDSCGEPMASISSMEISNGKATVALKFERLGLEVGQCVATVVSESSSR